MVTEESKLEAFKKIINEDLKKKSDEEIKAIEVETKKILDDLKLKNLDEIEKAKKQFEIRLNQGIELIKAKVEREGNEILLNETKAIYDEFFKDLKIRLNEEYLKEKGEEYIENIFKKFKTENIKSEDKVYLYEKTFERDKNIISKYLKDNEYIKADNIKIGGFLIEDKEKTYRLNYSLDFLLDNESPRILTILKDQLNLNK